MSVGHLGYSSGARFQARVTANGEIKAAIAGKRYVITDIVGSLHHTAAGDVQIRSDTTVLVGLGCAANTSVAVGVSGLLLYGQDDENLNLDGLTGTADITVSGFIQSTREVVSR